MLKRIKRLLLLLAMASLLTGCLGTGPEGTPTVVTTDQGTTISAQIDHVNDSTVTVLGVKKQYAVKDNINLVLQFLNYNTGPMDTKYSVRLMPRGGQNSVYSQVGPKLLQIGASQRQNENVVLNIPANVPIGDYNVNVYFDYVGKENKPIADAVTLNVPISVVSR